MVIVDRVGGCVKLRYVSYVMAPAHCQGGVSCERVSYVTFAKIKRSIPSGAQGRKRRKEEEEKKAKYRGKSSHFSHKVSNEINLVFCIT